MPRAEHGSLAIDYGGRHAGEAVQKSAPFPRKFLPKAIFSAVSPGTSSPSRRAPTSNARQRGASIPTPRARRGAGLDEPTEIWARLQHRESRAFARRARKPPMRNRARGNVSFGAFVGIHAPLGGGFGVGSAKCLSACQAALCSWSAIPQRWCGRGPAAGVRANLHPPRQLGILNAVFEGYFLGRPASLLRSKLAAVASDENFPPVTRYSF